MDAGLPTYTKAEIEDAVLTHLSDRRVTATQWLCRPARADMVGTRRLLNSLAKRGLVERQPSYTSGRNYHWRITDAGLRHIDVLPPGNATPTPR